MRKQCKASTSLYILILCLAVARAEDYGYGGDDGDDYQAYGDDGAAAYDDGYVANDDGGNNDDAAANDDGVQSWADYSVLPKRCFVYMNMDVILFSSYQYGYDQCIGRPFGTYTVPVTHFVEAYLNKLYSDAVDAGNDYEQPEAAQYLQCTQMKIGDGDGEDQYWAQLGCSESSSKALDLVLFSDDSCSTRVESPEDVWDGSEIDISDLVIPFKQCQSCVDKVESNDDAVDDQYNQNDQGNSPLCSSIWQYQMECDRSCQKMGHETFSSSGWNTSDKVLLSIMSVFGFGMLVAILRKRRNMSKKELLLEEAAMSAAGLQLTHIIGIFILVVIVIVLFALMGLKSITWALLLLLDTVLFAYLMKLTVDSGMAQSCADVCPGPDATALPDADHITSSTEMPIRQVV